MVEPDGVVENELVVSCAPVVADSFFTIYHQRGNAKHLESCCESESTLTSTCRISVKEQINERLTK